MHKLIILVDTLPDQNLFEKLWPIFLHEAEAMPGLRRETTSWTAGRIFGEYQPVLIHELYFDTREELERAMESPSGQAAGRTLQRLTGGKMSLLFAQHLEDEPENFQSKAASSGQRNEVPDANRG
jgi:hypothetical protein